MFETTTTTLDRGALSGPLAGISFIAGIAGANALAEGSYPRSGTEPNQLSRYFTQNPGPTRLSAVGQVVCSASLVRFTASVAQMAGRSGQGAPALHTAVVAGGAVARFPGLIVSGVAGVRLANGRHRDR